MRKMESTINKLQHEIEELKEIKKDLTKSEDKKSFWIFEEETTLWAI